VREKSQPLHRNLSKKIPPVSKDEQYLNTSCLLISFFGGSANDSPEAIQQQGSYIGNISPDDPCQYAHKEIRRIHEYNSGNQPSNDANNKIHFGKRFDFFSHIFEQSIHSTAPKDA
jgi:hypothetical protein